MTTERAFQQLGWKFEPIGRDIWKIYRTVSPYSITMTGSDVTTQLHIPWMHRWIRLHLYHTDSSYSASADKLDITLRRATGTVLPVIKFVDDLYTRIDLANSKIIKVFGENYEFEATTWSLILNSTNTDLVFVVVYVERLKKEMVPPAC